MSYRSDSWMPWSRLASAAATLLIVFSANPLAAQQPVPDDFFEGLRWQNVGPDRGGRSIGVAGSNARPLEYYFGATGGGLWKSTDGGITWIVTYGWKDHQLLGRRRGRL